MNMSENMLALGAAAQKAAEATTSFANLADLANMTNTKRPATRTERRAAARQHLADNNRAHRLTVARNIANDRGTLPDARELARIDKARKSITARLNAATNKAQEIDTIVAELPPERRTEAHEALSGLLRAQDAQ